MTTNAKPGELMPCPFCPAMPDVFIDGDGKKCACKICGYEVLFSIWQNREMQSPPVQSDEVRTAGNIAEKIYEVCANISRSDAENYIRGQLRSFADNSAAEQRVAPQTGDIDKVVELIKAKRQFANGQILGAKKHGIPSVYWEGEFNGLTDAMNALLTAHKGV